MAKAKTTEVAKYDQILAERLKARKTKEAKTGGEQNKINTRGGILAYKGNNFPGNKIVAVILSSAFEHALYTGGYDADNPKSPICWSVGLDVDELAPNPAVAAVGRAKAETCAECELNRFGSADKGRGKACKNVRRLALIGAGEVDKTGAVKKIYKSEDDLLGDPQVAYMTVPVTSVKNFKAYLNKIDAAYGIDCVGMYTLIGVELTPDAFTITFEALERIPAELLPRILDMAEAQDEEILYPYNIEPEEEEKPKKKAATSRAKKKY